MDKETKDAKKEDFYHFLGEKDWKNCIAIIDSFGEAGHENTAIELSHELNRAKYEAQDMPTVADYQDMDDKNPR